MRKQDFAAQVPGAVALPVATKQKGKAAKVSVKAIAIPAAYVAGPTPNKARKGTWRHYMVAVTLKASTPADAAKLHAKGARKAGFAPTAKLDFKWLLASGYIAPAA